MDFTFIVWHLISDFTAPPIISNKLYCYSEESDNSPCLDVFGLQLIFQVQFFCDRGLIGNN